MGVDPSLTVEVVAITPRGGRPSQLPEVIGTIRQEVADDYAAAASVLGDRDLDVVLIEHEFGIFGGDAGRDILMLVENLAVPIVVTLHTVLAEPSSSQSTTLRSLCARAERVMVFTDTARRMVVAQGLVDACRVRVVPHGAPDILTAVAQVAGTGLSRTHHLTTVTESPQHPLPVRSDQIVLSTFGLISASKGLELVIQALPAIAAEHPEVVYLVAGRTHPDVIEHEGEAYRLGLERLVRDLHLDDHVIFLDRFLSVEELARLLFRTDLYITPYRSREQIVSGALTFAVAAGCPVVSTPYFYAEDLLHSGAGVLVPFGDADMLAETVLQLLGSPIDLEAAREEARRVGAELTWASVGQATLDVLFESYPATSAGSWAERAGV